MAVTAASLKARFNEFAATADDVVTANIAAALARTSARVFSTEATFDEAVTLRAAHLLCISPGGTTGRLEGVALASPSTIAADLGRTTYGATLLGMMRERAGGPHMVGVGPLS